MKKVLATAAALAGVSATAQAEQAPAPAKKAAPRRDARRPYTKSGKPLPTKTELKKMDPEKRKYWEGRIADAYSPSWYRKMRVIQHNAARVKPTIHHMTRQLRRQEERRSTKMPLSVNQTEWHRQNNFEKGQKA